MATYFHGNSEIQGGGGDDGLQTLVLMNPGGYIQYSDTPPPQHNGNLVFLNSATATTAAGNNSLLSHGLSHGQQFIGIPQSMHGHHHDVSTAAAAAMHGFAPRGHYNLWNTIDPNTVAREAARATQGLSLSLPAMSGDDVRVSGGSPSSASGVTNVGNCGVSGIQSVLLSSKYLKATQELLEEVVNVNNNNGVNNKGEQQVKKSLEKNKVVGESSSCGGGGDSVGGGSEESGGKHGSELSTTERQEIQMKKAKLIAMLDEVEQRYRQYHNHMQIVISSFEQAAGIGSARTYTALALQTISKQFRCLKECITEQIKATNKSLGSEDDGGYDKIMEGGGGGSRLKYVDQHLRQQRAIQQLGMMHHHHHHHNAWRPQRGLPERSVSVLRAWLFEHFLHPYPKDSDKHMLAKQTGLTRGQVSNWFINARVRLWKPMVEEMYLEEMKDHEMNNGSEDKSSKNSEDPAMKTSSTTQEKGPNSETEHKIFNSKQDVSPIISVSTQLSTSPHVGGNLRNNNSSGFSFNIGSSSELDGITQGSPKKPRNNNEIMMHNNSVFSIDVKPNNDSNSDQLSMKFADEDDDDRQGRDSNGYSFIGNQTNFISGFGQYPIEEMTRFDVAEQFTTTPTRFSSGNSNSNNGVSLTLGLPHCDTISGTHQTFLQNQNIQLGMRLEMSETSEFGSSSAAFESINNMQNPKRFAAQLLPDFVA